MRGQGGGAPGARPPGRVRRVAGRQAEGVLPRSQPLAVATPTARTRSAVTTDGSETGPDQVRHGELGLRRGTRPDDRDVVVARQHARSPTTASTRRRCATTTCSSIRRSSTAAIDTEAYPKAGRPNPIVDLFVYDVAAKKSVKVDVRDGKPFDNAVVGHYVYRVALVARRHRAPLQPHQPPAERPGVRGRQPGDRAPAA